MESRVESLVYNIIRKWKKQKNGIFFDKVIGNYTIARSNNFNQEIIGKIIFTENVLTNFRPGISIIGNKKYLQKLIKTTYNDAGIKIPDAELRDIGLLHYDKNKDNTSRLDQKIKLQLQSTGHKNQLKMIKIINENNTILVYSHFDWDKI